MGRKQENGVGLTQRSNEETGTSHQWGLRPHNIPDLPLDIIINIISRLPLNLIISCKSLSKPIKNLLSNPSFSQIFRANNSDYFHAIFVQNRETAFSLDLIEFHKRDLFNHNNEISKVTVCDSDTDKLFGTSTEFSFFSMWGNCNGLFCFLIIQSNICHLYITNPILGELIQLPKPFVYTPNRMMFYAYGLGYCELTNRYKVLRIITQCTGVGVYKNYSEIITIGIDQNWRILSDVNVPYNLKYNGDNGANPQSDMVVFGSALHWVVQRIPMSPGDYLEPPWGGSGYICTFDMTEEKVSALPFPPLVAANLPFYGQLLLLLDRLCLWQRQIFQDDIILWVMDDYGVEGSWTKQFILKISTVPPRIGVMIPLTVSPEGVGVVVGRKLIFYDFNRKECLNFINQSGHPIHFVPNFVSISQSC